MPRAHRILSVGELLVDFVSTTSGVNLKTASQFAKCAGGAPANVAVGIARLGTPSSFIGKVGDDSFGRFLIGELGHSGVDTSGMIIDSLNKTRLAFVSLMNNGERDFEFWERHPADEQLHYAEINQAALVGAKIVNIGSFLLLKNPSRNAALEIAKRTRSLGKDVCYDPNLRLSLWENTSNARRVMTKMLRRATIVRMNDAEAAFFTGHRSLETGARKLRSLGAKLVVVTTGHKGCYFQTRTAEGFVGGFRIRPIDTTGCGDGFLAGLLHGLAGLEEDYELCSPEKLRAICTVANAVGALVALRRGAIAAMPTRKELLKFLNWKRKS